MEYMLKNLLRYGWGRKHAKITWCASKVHFPFKAEQFHSFADSSWADVLPNNGCIALGNSGHFKGRSRHTDLRYMFLTDYIARGLVKFERVDSKNQIADIGTAPIPWPVFQRHRPVLYGES